MKASGLLKLVAVTAVVVTAAVVFRDTPAAAGREGADRGVVWLPQLAERLNDVAAVTVHADGERFTVRRRGDDWVIDEWQEFPATFESVKGALVGLADLQIVEPKTARPERHAQLELEDPSGDQAASLGLTLADADGNVLADVIVGKAKGDRGRFVRRAGEDQTWQVDGRLQAPRSADGWVDKQLLRVPASDVTAVSVTHPDGERVALTKDDSGDWQLEHAPEGRELRSFPPYAGLAGAIGFLDMEGVGDAEQAGAQREWIVTRFETADGLVIEVSSAEQDGRAWARLRVVHRQPADAEVGEDPEQAEASEDPEQAEAGEQGEAAATGEAFVVSSGADVAEVDAAEQAAELQQRLGAWTFAIPTWKASALAKHLEDFLEPLPEEEPPEEEPADENGPAALDGDPDPDNPSDGDDGGGDDDADVDDEGDG